MAASPEQLLHAVQTIEVQLNIIKQSLSEMGVREEGVIGTFDGEFMILDNGKRFQIPPNYASKSMLVPGDTLRLIEDPAGVSPRFKQIAKAERIKSTGLLTKKDGKFEVLCEEGSFKVLTAAVKHFEGDVGDSATIQFAKNHPKNSWAAVEKVVKANGSSLAEPQVGSQSEPTVEVESAVESTIEPVQPTAAAAIAEPPQVSLPPVQPIAHHPEVEMLTADPAVAEAPVAEPIAESKAKVAAEAPAVETVVEPPVVKSLVVETPADPMEQPLQPISLQPVSNPAPTSPADSVEPPAPKPSLASSPKSSDTRSSNNSRSRDRRDDRGSSSRSGSNSSSNGRSGNREEGSHSNDRPANRDSSRTSDRSPRNDDRPRTSSASTNSATSRPTPAPVPNPTPEPAPILSNQTGEIPVAAVMDDDDLQ